MGVGSKVVIVTGASSGLGRATAIALSQSGHQVMVVSRRADPLQETARQCAGGSASVFEGDIGLESTCERLIDRTRERFGRIDALVNNAGVAPRTPLSQVHAALLQDAFQTNVFGPMLLLRAAWHELTRHDRSVVVNVSSMAACDPLEGFGVYGASKAALESLTRSIHIEGAAAGIEAYSLRLGAVDTELFRAVVGDDPKAGRPLAPEFVAEVIVGCIEGMHTGEQGRVIQLVAR